MEPIAVSPYLERLAHFQDVFGFFRAPSIMVAALRTRHGAANAVLRLVAKRRLVALATPPLFLEYEDVLKRPKQQLVHGRTAAAVDPLLAELAALLEPVEIHFREASGKGP